MKKTVILLMVLAILSKVVVYLHDVVLAYFYGAGDVTDVYFIAITIPLLLFSFFGTAINTALIPKYHEIELKKSLMEAEKFNSKILNLMIYVISLILVLLLIFTEEVVYLFASGFTASKMSLAIEFTRIVAFSLIFSLVAAVFKSYLHLKGVFWVSSIINAPKYVIIIGSIVISSFTSPYLIAYGFLVGSIVQVLIYLPFVLKSGFRYYFNLKVFDRESWNFFLLVLPVLFTIAITDINKIIDKNLASLLDSGSVSYLQYAFNVTSLFQVIIVTSITTVIYPRLSKISLDLNRREEFKDEIYKGVTLSLLLLIPSFFGVMFFSNEMISLLYGRGEFGSESIRTTSRVLVYYGIGIIGMGSSQIFNRGLYALKKFKKSFFASIVTVSVNIILNFIFFYNTDLGINGLALATSISLSVSAIVFALVLRKEANGLNLKRITRPSIIIILASGIMTVIIKVILSYLDNIFVSNGSFVVSAVIGILVYFILLMLFNLEEMSIIKKTVKKVFNR